MKHPDLYLEASCVLADLKTLEEHLKWMADRLRPAIRAVEEVMESLEKENP